ncbi:hypothetical protein Pint_21884 [Pistacia integerrima]|uniref:Uncharacterized protein n=1 Tax=Pistacia integerrima TaxID=434235 RepID=A0ACC0X8D4_9ROSI|nr:hypothetical protein Pint_21884 [Pistacia integerrima]
MAYRRMWCVVPCTSRRSLRTDSRKNIEDILNAKLSTIKEDPGEMCEAAATLTPQTNRRSFPRKPKSKRKMTNIKMGRLFVPHFTLKVKASPI